MYGSESDQVIDVDIWSSYSMNGESNSTHHSGARAGNHLLFFDSGYMPYAEYTLQIYVGYAEDDAGYFLDYIRYETTNPVVTSTSQLPSLVTPTNSPTLTLASNTANASPSVALHSSQSPTMSPWTSPWAGCGDSFRDTGVIPFRVKESQDRFIHHRGGGITPRVCIPHL